jgi:choline-sulfatase
MNTPNILWICPDQQRWDTLGCYGNPYVKTPNLDFLAANGTVFDTCFTQNPVCTPSRACFLTGRYPRTTRTRQNGQNIPADEVLVTRIMSEAGYTCGLSGKLHLSACYPTVCKDVEQRINDGYTEFHWSHDNGSAWTGNEYHHWLKEKGVAYGRRPHPETPWVFSGPAAENHQTTWCAEKAVDFIHARAAGDQPWLFSVNIFDPHDSFDPPKEYLDRYMDFLDDIPLPNYVEGELDNKSSYQQAAHHAAYNNPRYLPFTEMSEREHRLCRAAYWAMCDLIDDQVGRMLNALDETKQRENTIVIFISDHGEMLGDHGIYTKGPFFYEGAVRVPFIISWPGNIKARRSTALVELADIAQTLLDASGLPHHPGMQGQSLWPMLTGSAEPSHHRDDVYCEYYNAMPFFSDPQAHMTMVRTASHKLVVDHTTSNGELYDLENDPNETINRWDDPAHAETRSGMLLRMCNRMAWTADPLPERIAPW